MLKKRSLLFLFLFLFCSPVLAEAGSIHYILDASGSMWGRVAGKSKIVVAKEVLTRLVKEMPADINSGLTVYGHRKKGDCTDIEELIPLGPLDRTATIAAINSITPKGRTPIAASISRVVEQLRGPESATTIVLISDGIETCGGDPCAVTKALKDSGISFIMHTVGLDVGQSASAQLACIAQAGGGRYFPVNSADELLQTLTTVQESVVRKIPIAPAPALKAIKQQVTAASSSTSIRIKAKRPGKISFVTPNWLHSPYYWKLLDPETGAEKARFNTLKTTLVPVGEYQLAWRQYEHEGSDVVLGEVFTVKSGQTVTISLATSIRLQVPSWVKTPYFWKLRDPKTGEDVVEFKKLEPFLVPPGEYDLVWRQTEHSATSVKLQSVNIVADKLNDVKVSTAFNPVAADWMPQEIYYWGLKSGESSGSGPWVARFREQFSPQLVPPGKYQLIYRLSEHGSSDSLLGEVEITQSKMNEFTVNTGVSFILPAGMKPPCLVELIELDGQGKELRTVKLKGTYLAENFGHIALAPGTYKINYRQTEHNSTTLTIVDAFDLSAGNLVEIEL